MFRCILMLGIGGALLSFSPPSRADSLRELVRKADRVLRGNTSAGVFTMEVKTSSFRRSFKIVMWEDSRKKDRSLIKILGPALWRGNGTLKVGSQLKLFNPRTNHVTVVSNSMLGDSWMGSHFTNDDLVKETRLERHFTHQLIKKYSGKNDAGDAVEFYRIKLRPRPSAPVAWGKIIYVVWARGELVMPKKALYFRKVTGKRPDRTLSFSDVKTMGGRAIPATMKMTVAKKKGEFTAITYSKMKFDIKIPDSKFTEQALKR